jgi:glycogen synthase
MRVLFWPPAFWPEIGGVEVLAAKLLPALRECGHESIVVTSQNNPHLPRQETYRGIPIYRFPFWSALVDIDDLARVNQQVAELKRTFAPDLIHINGLGRDHFFHLTTANAGAAPVLVTLHGEWIPQAEAIVGSVLRGADWVVGCSKAILEKGRRLVPEITPRSSVIYNAVESPKLAPAPLPIRPPLLLCLGRLSQEKGFDLALSAFAATVEQFPGARLVIAGDGVERERLIKQAAAAGLNDAVDFLGWVAPENVPALINTATMVVMPSRSEALPLVALQAAQMARPVVATRVGGLPEVVVDQESGLLVEEENPRELAAAIFFLLEHREAAVRMGEAGRARAQRVFNWERHVNAYDELYRRLAKPSSSADGLPLDADKNQP